MSFLFGRADSSSAASNTMAGNDIQIRTPEEAVSRIAYLASDVIVSVQPAQGQDSAYSSHLNRYAARRDPGLVSRAEGAIPEVSFQLLGYSY